MPELSRMVINTLTSLTNVLENNLTGPNDYVTPVCFHWALTGLTQPCVGPDSVFAHMNGALNFPISRRDRSWLNTPANAAPLTAIMNTYRDAVAEAMDNVARDAALTTASVAAARRIIAANGLTTSAGVTNYRLFMEYDTRNANHGYQHLVVPPNYQHWWLDVGGCKIETFPNLRYVRIYKCHNPVAAGIGRWSTYLTELHQDQVDVINKIVDLRKAWWVNVPLVPGGRQPWVADVARPRCSWCNKAFGCLTRRHHCRRCGEIFCDHCTRWREEVHLPATRPGTPAETDSAGEVRVCVRCRE
jgi:hypothetical protein